MGRQTLVVQDVLPEIVFKTGHAVQYERGGIKTDGAVRAVDDVPRSGFDLVQGLHRGFTVQDLLQQGRKLPQTDAAGGAFSAGLCVAEVQEAECDVDGAEAGRTGGNAPFHAGIHVVHEFLSLTSGSDFKSAHS